VTPLVLESGRPNSNRSHTEEMIVVTTTIYLTVCLRFFIVVPLGVNNEPNVPLKQSVQCVQMVLTGYLQGVAWWRGVGSLERSKHRAPSFRPGV